MRRFPKNIRSHGSVRGKKRGGTQCCRQTEAAHIWPATDRYADRKTDTAPKRRCLLSCNPPPPLILSANLNPPEGGKAKGEGILRGQNIRGERRVRNLEIRFRFFCTRKGRAVVSVGDNNTFLRS